MNYPLWHIPYIGGSWLIGIIACIHIFISHFAVGGGIYFAITEWLAYKNNNEKIYDYLKSHSKFFLLLTTVAGAVTGVAIWWAVSLVSPDGLATLIQTYTLGWATEYIFFVAELATIFAYYYTWDKVDKKTHLSLAQYYAVFSVLTLVIINGILSFMLTPGTWLQTGVWREGFFNEGYLPSLLIRLIVMIAIAGMYALVTSTYIKDEDFKAYMLRYSAKWFLPVFVLGPILAFWYFQVLPDDVVKNIFTGLQSSGIGNFSILARALYLSLILSGTTLLFAFVGPYLNPRGFTRSSAILFLFCGLLVTSIGEWSREMLRKPYVIYNYMYSNGLRKSQLERFSKDGFAAHAKWLPEGASVGEAMFKQQCMSCHSIGGYRDIRKLLAGRDKEAIKNFLHLIREIDPQKNPYTHIMPPVLGTDEELEDLSNYLGQIKD